MTNGFGHHVIAISRTFLKDQWKFLPWWLLSKSEYNVILPQCVYVAYLLVVRILGLHLALPGNRIRMHLHYWEVLSGTHPENRYEQRSQIRL